jgi:hypothetical protein
MSEYSNTDTSAVFPPNSDTKLILQGKLYDGDDYNGIVIIKEKTRKGKEVRRIYKAVGIIFPNDKGGNDKAPDYTGEFEDRRVAYWKGVSQSGTAFMSGKVTDKRDDGPSDNQTNNQPGGDIKDDDISF